MSTTAELVFEASAPVIPPMTADEFWLMPHDGMKHELVKGVLLTMPPTGFEHGKITASLTAPLATHAKQNKLGAVCGAETGFIIAREPDTVRAPDIAFVQSERVEQLGATKKFFPAAPDLAVEVLSPGDTVYEVDEKVEEWLQGGARAVWIVNPKRRTVTVYRSLTDFTILTENDELDGEDVVPGFRCRVAEIFA